MENPFKKKTGDGKSSSKKGTKGGPTLPKGPRFLSNILSTILILVLIVTAYSLFVQNQEEIEEIPLSRLAAQVSEGRVESITVEGEELHITLTNEEKRLSKKETEAALSETLTNYGVTAEQLAGVDIDVREPSGFGVFLLNALPFLLPIIFIVLLFWLLTRQVRGAGMQAFNFGQSKARIIDPADKNQRVTFSDVAGVKEAKEELKEIVDFLRNPKKFLDIGARIPKGVLLMGAPGTGKTLLARAVAGEAKVPFFHLSGSEFVEMFVGVGASRVRDLFKMAKKAAPSIVFIDEIDAVGRMRGSGIGGGNDEREQTLNQILVEMDGFEPTEKVIVMAATNRPDVLDPALSRPGRFDRRVILDLPDREDREHILNIHAQHKPFEGDVDISLIAQRTPGFSGADLYSLMNEAAILAARENRKKVAQNDLIRSIEKVMLGPERRSHVMTKKEKEIVAYHEAGHALVSSVLPHADPVHKISVVSRGHAGGYTLTLPEEEKKLRTRTEFVDDISVKLGGYVAEKLVFGDLTTGPSNDLQVATATARNMVTRWGMSEKLGPVALETDEGRVLMGRGSSEREYSESKAAEIDTEVADIMEASLEQAKETLTMHRTALDAIAKELLRVESLERPDYEKILKEHGIVVRGKQQNKHEK